MLHLILSVGTRYFRSVQLDPMALFLQAFDTVEVQTAFTDPVLIDLKAPPDPNSPSAKLMATVRPVIVLRGRAGTITIPPDGYNPADQGYLPDIQQGAVIGVGSLLGLVGVFFLIRGFFS